MNGKLPSVFICYAKQDFEKAREIFQFLSNLGVDPWMDKEKLVHGDDWEAEIKKAVLAADVVVVCLRPGFDDVGFRQQEVRWAIQALHLRPPGRGFIIPFIVEPCELPDWCKPFHAGNDLDRPTTLDELRRAVEKHCGVALRVTAEDGPGPGLQVYSRRQRRDGAEREPKGVRAVDFPSSLRKKEASLAIAKELNTRSGEGQNLDPTLSWEEVLEIVRSSNAGDSDPERETKAAVHELETLGLVSKISDANSPWGWHSIGPTDDFFWKTDTLFQPWRPKEDALEVCKRARQNDHIPVEEVDAELGWGPRRINSALAYLAAHNLIDYFEDSGGTRYILRACSLNEEGHLFLEDTPG